MKVLKGGLQEAISLESSKRGVSNLSKRLTVGTKYRLIFRKVGQDELLVASAFGRSLDFKALGGTFMGFEDDEVEYNSETRMYKDVTVIPSLCRVARVLHKAACEHETREAVRRVREEAEAIGSTVSEVAIAEAARRTKCRYFGDDTVKPAIPPEVKPVISGVITPHIVEVYAIPLDSNGVPEFTKGFVGALELRSNKMTQLATLLHDVNYNIPGREYLEVGFDYIGKDKQEAGRNAGFSGIAESLSLETKFHDAWEANKEKIFADLSKTEDEVFSKCITFKLAKSAKDVVSAFNKYVSTQAITLSCIDFESEETKAAAKDFLTLDVVQKAPKISARFEELCADDKNTESEGDVALTAAKELSEKKTIAELSAVADYDEKAGVVGDVEEL